MKKSRSSRFGFLSGSTTQLKGSGSPERCNGLALEAQSRTQEVTARLDEVDAF